MIKNKVKHFEHNVVGQDYIVGDLHGCLADLKNLLNFVGFDKAKDRLFSVGDLVDRGPDSLGCLRLLKEQWFHAVIGNHEQMMQESLRKHNPDPLYYWEVNGGGWFSALSEEHKNEVHELIEYVEELPLVIVIGKNTENRINIVHAELYREKTFDLATDEDIDDWYFSDINENGMTWGRQIVQLKSMYLNKDRPGLSLTVAGHTPVDFPVSVQSHLFLDTGAVYWHKQKYEKAKLTMMRVSDRKIFFVDMKTETAVEI